MESDRMIGIIGAMPVEIEALQAQMTETAAEVIGMDTFVTGNLYGRPAVLAVCGPGKVNAALCAQSMILRFHPVWILNIGAAGAGDADVHICDIVIATATVQHDVDTSPIGDPVCMVSKINLVEIPCDEALRQALSAAVCKSGFPCHEGIIATGDQFIGNTDDKQRIHDLCGARAIEMEGAAIAQACYMHHTPCGVLRSVSDNAAGRVDMDYPQFVRVASAQVHQVVKALLEECV